MTDSLQDIHIRPAQNSDIEAMVLLLENLFLLEKDFSFDSSRQRSGLTQILDRDHCVLLVAEKSGQVIGMCSGQTVISTAEGGASLLVEDVVVTKEHQRKGIGKRLLLSIKTWAEDHSISRLQLLADHTNTPALQFYEQQGWQTTRLICLRTYT